MEILLFYGYIAGLFTILSPCIWPVLPIVFAASDGSRSKSFGVALGVVASFSFFTLLASFIVRSCGIDIEIFRYVAVAIIGLMGLALLIPKFGGWIEAAVSFLSSKMGGGANLQRQGFVGGLITGLSLGVIWTPCAGPILATIVAVAATQSVDSRIVALTLAYAIGVGTPLLVLSLLGQKLWQRVKGVSKYTGRIQQFLGALMVTMAILILTNYDKTLQARILDIVPSYSNFLYQLETSQTVQNRLDSLRHNESQMPTEDKNSYLPILNKAPEITGITNWINSDPLTLEQLRGKVVLVDFWTYTCINCIRTLPYVTSWYDKYRDDGLVIIGVHTPEFEFESKSKNVEQAAKRYSINYPIAQDNNYATWNNYANHYWPAHYLIDKNGFIRQIHYGEGKYEETEQAIRSLLREAGTEPTEEMSKVQEESTAIFITPETYLGTDRIDRNANKTGIREGDGGYEIPSKLGSNSFAFGGGWTMSPEYAQSHAGAKLNFRFNARKVFLVIMPGTEDEKIKVSIEKDGNDISTGNLGADIEKGYVKLDEQRLYELVNFKTDGAVDAVLSIEFETGGARVYAFTFG